MISILKLDNYIQEIGSYAFYNCASLSGAVDIPTATKVVRGGAFSGCTSVTSVTTHQNDTLEWTGRIEGSAFARCTALTSVEIAGSIKSIGAYAFEECNKLSTVTLHEGITTLGSGLFNGCSALTTLTIPEGVTSLGSYMIRGTGIASITIPSTVTYSETSNGNGALAGCMTLNEVVFAQGTVKIPDNICASPDQNSYIKSVKIPESIQEIGSYAFYNCASLSGAVDIPTATKVVRGGAFSGCTSVTSVTTHQNDTLEWTGRIEGSAFARCTALTSVEIAGSIKSIGAYAFEECNKLLNPLNWREKRA